MKTPPAPGARNDLRRPFRWAHGILAIVAGALCILLSVTGGGHPPPIIFVPVVAVVWVVGHLLLWGIRRLAVKGAILSSRKSQPWPPGLIMAVIGTGAAAALGVLQLLITALIGEFYPFRGMLWVITLLIWAAHAVCLAGLLLRRPWSRWTAALLSLGWSALLIRQLLAHVLRGYPIHPMELAVAIGLIVLLTAFGVHLLASARIRVFFRR